MSRRLLRLVAVCLVLLPAVTPHAHTPAPVATDMAETTMLRRADADHESALDVWYFTAAGQTTTTTAPPEPPPTEGNLRAQAAQQYPAGEVQQLIVQVFGAHGQEALAVADCESGFNPTASNGTHWGIFQLGAVHRARAERLGFSWADVQTKAYPNIVVAHDLFEEQGWGPWSCRP